MPNITKLKRYIRPDSGASMVEYAFLVILIAIIAFTAIQLVGNEVTSSYSQASDAFHP